MMGPCLVTMCNDRMLPHLRRFMAVRETIVPDLPCMLIPFDQRMEGVVEFVSGLSNVHFINPDPFFDDLGQRIYGDEEYRPGIKSWRYFRKLNAFFSGYDRFLFLDLNTFLLADPRGFLGVDPDMDSIIFGTRSMLARTIPVPEVRHTLDLLLPGGGAGFNAAVFFAKSGFLSKQIAAEIGKKGIRKLFGVAPEQGFLSYYCAVCGKDAKTIGDLSPALSDLRNPSNLPVELIGGQVMIARGPLRGRRLIIGKHVGQDIMGLPQPIVDFFRKANPNVDWAAI